MLTHGQMISMISGEQVVLLTPTIAYDENKDEIETWTETPINNVLFGRPSTTQIDEVMRLYSVEISYALGIPKTFKGSLRGCLVRRLRDGLVYRVLGDPQPLPIENCPTPWNREAAAVIVDG